MFFNTRVGKKTTCDEIDALNSTERVDKTRSIIAGCSDDVNDPKDVTTSFFGIGQATVDLNDDGDVNIVGGGGFENGKRDYEKMVNEEYENAEAQLARAMPEAESKKLLVYFHSDEYGPNEGEPYERSGVVTGTAEK